MRVCVRTRARLRARVFKGNSYVDSVLIDISGKIKQYTIHVFNVSVSATDHKDTLFRVLASRLPCSSEQHFMKQSEAE